MKLTVLLAASSGLLALACGALTAAAVAGGSISSTKTTTAATLTIPGPNSIYTGTLTVRELEMFTVTRGDTVTERTQAPIATVTDTTRETVTVQTAGPRGPRGFRGPPGPQGPAGGTTCPPGFTFQTLTLNAPGGQVTMFVCIS